MTAQTSLKERARQPWAIRKVFYNLVSAVAVIAFVVFGVSVQQIDSAMDLMEPSLSVLLAVVSRLAASRANPGADMGAIPAPTPAPAPQPIDIDVIAGSVAARVFEHFAAPGAHRADASETLDALREALAAGGAPK